MSGLQVGLLTLGVGLWFIVAVCVLFFAIYQTRRYRRLGGNRSADRR